MPTYRRIKAVELTTAIIKYLAQQSEPVNASQIAGEVGDAYGTVMCHLATLADAGFVKQSGGDWELGLYLGVAWARLRRVREQTITQARQELNLLEQGASDEC